MKRLLPLSILVSTLLTGCGTGSGVDGGSGGSTSSQPSENVTFEFIQLRPVSEAQSATCTFFDGTGQNSDAKTFGKVAKDVTVKVYHADGSFDKTLVVSDKGQLQFKMNDVEDGGYVSVIDSPSGDDPLYKVLSIQKELLGNYLININRNQGDVDCYRSNKGKIRKAGFASVVPNGVIVNEYGFDTSHSALPKQGKLSINITADQNEKVLARAYNNEVLTGYAFVSNLSVVPHINPTLLEAVDADYQWSIGQTLKANELEKVAVRLVNGDYSYPWYELEFDKVTLSTIKFPYVSTVSDWSYSAVGKTAENWRFLRNGILPASLDVDLPDSLTLSDNAPAIAANGDTFVFSAKGVSSTEKLVQRSYYSQSGNINGKPTTLDHSIYSIADSNGNVIIPDLALPELDPVSPNSISVSVIETKSRNAELTESFMRRYQGKDLVSVVLTPAERIKHDKVINMSNYTLVER